MASNKATNGGGGGGAQNYYELYRRSRCVGEQQQVGA